MQMEGLQRPPPPNPEGGGRGGGGGGRHRKTLVLHGGLSARGERPPCCPCLLPGPVRVWHPAVPWGRKDVGKRGGWERVRWRGIKVV